MLIQTLRRVHENLKNQASLLRSCDRKERDNGANARLEMLVIEVTQSGVDTEAHRVKKKG